MTEHISTPDFDEGCVGGGEDEARAQRESKYEVVVDACEELRDLCSDRYDVEVLKKS